MKMHLLPLLLLLVPIVSNAQSISGRWKGYVVESDFSQFEQRYQLEMEIEELPMQAVRCTTSIFRKGQLVSRSVGMGFFRKSLGYFVFGESTFLFVKDSSHDQHCKNAFRLTYETNVAETLRGISRSMLGTQPCGEGKVFLRRYVPKEIRQQQRAIRKEKRLERREKRKSRKTTRV